MRGRVELRQLSPVKPIRLSETCVKLKSLSQPLRCWRICGYMCKSVWLSQLVTLTTHYVRSECPVYLTSEARLGCPWYSALLAKFGSQISQIAAFLLKLRCIQGGYISSSLVICLSLPRDSTSVQRPLWVPCYSVARYVSVGAILRLFGNKRKSKILEGNRNFQFRTTA